MGRLTAEHTAFLRKHGFAKPRDWALNATGMTRRQFSEVLRQEGKIFAYGLAPCPEGHTLRTSGGCPQCNTSYIAYAKRRRLPGYVYIAKSGRLTKVGFSQDPDNRIYIANLEGYAGAQDWSIRAWVYSSNAGQIELDVHRALNGLAANQPWERSAAITYSKEVFRCSYATARQALLSVLTPLEALQLIEFR